MILIDSEQYPKEIILKDGSGATLRPLAQEDEGRVQALFDRLSEEDKWFLDEDLGDSRVIERWLARQREGQAASFVAVLEKKIIALANLAHRHFGSRRHIGEIGITVDPEFREQHVATWMLLDLMNVAMSRGLETLTMCMVEGRDSGLMESLKRLGFHSEALLKDYVKDKAGNAHDLHIMVKHIRVGLSRDPDSG